MLVPNRSQCIYFDYLIHLVVMQLDTVTVTQLLHWSLSSATCVVVGLLRERLFHSTSINKWCIEPYLKLHAKVRSTVWLWSPVPFEFTQIFWQALLILGHFIQFEVCTYCLVLLCSRTALLSKWKPQCTLASGFNHNQECHLECKRATTNVNLSPQ